MWEYIDVCRKRFSRHCGNGLLAPCFCCCFVTSRQCHGRAIVCLCSSLCLRFTICFALMIFYSPLGLRVESPLTLQTCNQSPCATLYRSRIVMMNLHYEPPKTASCLSCFAFCLFMHANELRPGTVGFVLSKKNPAQRLNSRHFIQTTSMEYPRSEGCARRRTETSGCSAFDHFRHRGTRVFAPAYQAYFPDFHQTLRAEGHHLPDPLPTVSPRALVPSRSAAERQSREAEDRGAAGTAQELRSRERSCRGGRPKVRRGRGSVECDEPTELDKI
ncbi:hypothetical protein CALCODRAFT_250360 [Calocera cornea HHB12733]|uniref:Transmembrane protein n=1 Tax=Calocera cornea HHB12733 TaxID=1353952 RepID=A0A165JWR6_9BASI|nr:hypothetical protein CALCODRAFT_250360 [Calocera cornea HHB12733]